jgi:hypothetical protein
MCHHGNPRGEGFVFGLNDAPQQAESSEGNSMAEASEKPLALRDWIPASWLEPSYGGAVWQTGYRVLRANRDALLTGPQIFDAVDARAMLLWGRLSYLDFKRMPVTFSDDGAPTFTISPATETAEGTYLLIACPIQGTLQGGEAAARQRIEAAVGFLGLFLGRNVVYERLFDAAIEVSTGQMHYVSPFVENPLYFPPPNLSEAALAAVSEASANIAKLSAARRARIGLSLRWYDQATRSSGADAWLKYWIAIESLAMSNLTDKKGLCETLARGYGLTGNEAWREAWQRFSIEKLFDFRARIVHQGRIPAVHSHLLSYLAALYADILRTYLGLAPQRRAEALMSEPDFYLQDYLSATNRKGQR